jgi:DNA-binding NarL/FixJ family response regulator
MEASTRRPLRLILVDDDAGERDAAAARICRRSGLTLVAQTGEPAEALRLVLDLRPDAVLVNTRRRDGRGLDSVAVLTSLAPEVRPVVVMYVEMRHSGGWPEVRALGADDIILKELIADIFEAELIDVIERVRHERRRRPGERDMATVASGLTAQARSRRRQDERPSRHRSADR